MINDSLQNQARGIYKSLASARPNHLSSAKDDDPTPQVIEEFEIVSSQTRYQDVPPKKNPTALLEEDNLMEELRTSELSNLQERVCKQW